MDRGRIRSAMTVIRGLMLSIITSTPRMVVTEVITWVALWFRLCPSVSTSLVMRERISPCVMRSKYCMGRRSIFSEISLRSR